MIILKSIKAKSSRLRSLLLSAGETSAANIPVPGLRREVKSRNVYRAGPGLRRWGRGGANSHLQALSLHRKAFPIHFLPVPPVSMLQMSFLTTSWTIPSPPTTPSAACYPQSKPQFLPEISLSKATQEFGPQASAITTSTGTTNHLSLLFSSGSVIALGPP